MITAARLERPDNASMISVTALAADTPYPSQTGVCHFHTDGQVRRFESTSIGGVTRCVSLVDLECIRRRQVSSYLGHGMAGVGSSWTRNQRRPK